jgi:hypothetical protein
MVGLDCRELVREDKIEGQKDKVFLTPSLTHSPISALISLCLFTTAIQHRSSFERECASILILLTSKKAGRSACKQNSDGLERNSQSEELMVIALFYER